jgi:acetoin utilization deacetylase AcuC-like enzyme
VSVLEGGYDLEGLLRSVAARVTAINCCVVVEAGASRER